MHEALLECAADLFRLIAVGEGESREAGELRELIRYYFGTMTRDEQHAVLRDVVQLRRQRGY